MKEQILEKGGEKMIIGIIRTKGTKFFSVRKYENGFDFCLNLIPKVFGFYIWVELQKVKNMVIVMKKKMIKKIKECDRRINNKK